MHHSTVTSEKPTNTCTSAVEVSIHAVSPLFGAGASAAQASAGASRAKSAARRLEARANLAAVGIALSLKSGRSHDKTPAAPAVAGAYALARCADDVRRKGADSVPLRLSEQFPRLARAGTPSGAPFWSCRGTPCLNSGRAKAPRSDHGFISHR